MKKYDFISDPGHGWLKVERAELIALGIIYKISNCSYQDRSYVYLEEDCDAPIFIKAKEEKGELLDFNEIHQENTPIRNLPSFRLR
jgi:hypothetical protein